MVAEDGFEIKLPQFEGPFDLLLFFIERDELDIYDIPIAKVADDFLNYLHHMATLNMELASEFIFVAATLMRIKAKMLLPRYEVDEAGNEIDHKEDLIRKLIEYKKIKQVCEKRGNIAYDLEQVEKVPLPGDELQELSLYRLMMVYDRLSKNYELRERQVTHTIEQYPYTIEKQKEAIKQLLSINKMLDFKSIAGNSDNKVHFVYNFLAVLEMLQQELVKIEIGLGFNNFWVSAREA
jgi:segregation and condensation protein A